MKQPKAKTYLSDIAVYVGGKTSAAGGERLIKLSSNENPHGPSPRAIAAYEATSNNLHRYPQDACISLREAIETKHGFSADQLIVGAGSDEVIGMVVKAYAGVGDEVLFPEHAFLMYRIYAQQCGATSVTAAETNLTTDVDKLLAAVTDNTKIIFVANPNNPTGSYISKDELSRLRDGLRDDIILVLDGAYAEYMVADDYSDGRELVENSNTIITHTFSKLYGLPALRVGWGYGPKHIIDTLYKVRSPFNVSQPAIAAAIAALEDADYATRMIEENNAQREWLENEITALGLTVSPSVANFILVHFSDEDGKRSSDANAYLMKQGIIPREVANYGLPHCLRVSVGTEAENKTFVNILKDFVK